MRVLIIGAGGFIGRHLTGRLAADGDEPVPAGRAPGRLTRLYPDLTVVACDLASDTAEDWQPRLTGIDAVVNLAGLIHDRRGAYNHVHDHGARALFDACHAAGVRRVVQVSALGADESATTRYHRSKKAADDHLASLDPTGARMDWVVVRPSLVIGRGGQSTDMFTALAAMPWPMRLGAGNWQLQPIHVDDLVEAIVRLLRSPQPIAACIDAVGPQPMTTDEITLALRRWLGLASKPFLTLPRALLRLAAWCGERLALGAATRESLAMLEEGNVGSVEPLAAATGFRPKPLAQALGRRPAALSDKWRAHLFFLRLPLRLLLALVWIATGIVSLGIYPVGESYKLLSAVGIPDALAPAALYGTAALDLLLGLALLAGRRVLFLGLAQLALMAGYTLILTIALPELWLHPFGPLTKNFAVAGATLAMLALEANDD